MYESHFRLHRRPFSPAADTSCYVGIGPIEDARLTLVRAVGRASGPAVVIGGAGTGKTMLCQVIAEQFRQQMRVAVLPSGRLASPRALYQAILFALRLPYREMDENELRLSLIDFLSDKEQCPEGLLLVIDEAHLLPLRLLEEVRMMTNLVHDGRSRVRLVVAGGPVLEERLSSPKLESFNQRIAARCYLDNLNREEVAAFIKEQLAMAGAANKPLLSGDAIKAVYDATDGIPRLVNQLCDHVMVMAAVALRREVDVEIVQEAWSDLQQLPTPWIEPPEVAGPAAQEPSVIEFGALADDSDDASPASIPFPLGRQQVAARQAAAAALDPEERLDEIERQVAAASQAENIFPPPSANPFDEVFDEEEEVVDSYASLQDNFFADAPRVKSAEGREIAAMLAAAEKAVAGDQHEAQRRQRELTDAVAAILPQGLAAHREPDDYAEQDYAEQDAAARGDAASAAAETDIRPAVDPLGDDRDLIIVQEAEDDRDPPPSNVNRSQVQRQKYRQLFARLRQA